MPTRYFSPVLEPMHAVGDGLLDEGLGRARKFVPYCGIPRTISNDPGPKHMYRFIIDSLGNYVDSYVSDVGMNSYKKDKKHMHDQPCFPQGGSSGGCWSIPDNQKPKLKLHQSFRIQVKN